MNEKKVILLDEYDLYKSKHDSSSRNFVITNGLTPVLINSERGRQISGKHNMPSGSIMIQSPNNENKYFSILNATQEFKNEYFEILLEFAPLLGASEVFIKCEIDEEQIYKNRAKYQGELKAFGTEAKAEACQNSLSEKIMSIKRTQSQKTNPVVVDKEKIIEKLKNRGINYLHMPILYRMLNMDNLIELRDEIYIRDVMHESKSTLQKLSANGEIKKIPILKRVGVDYEGESETELILINETKILIEIKFHR